MTCQKCNKHKSKITYKDKNYCTWYCAKKGDKQDMIELKCKKCNDETIKCDDDVVAVTCGTCSMTDLIDHLYNEMVGIA